MSAPEDTIEKVDQEITLQLQKIDSNLSYCFNKITKDIIPQVTRYGSICDDIMDSGNWLGTMFQQTAQVDLKLNSPGIEGLDENSARYVKSKSPETIFPMSARRKLDSSSEVVTPAVNASAGEEDFHTANVTTTTTGQVLRLPSDSSDDDATGKLAKAGEAEADGSTLQRQRRKRKVSLLLQQEYASSSSMGLSPIHINPNKSRAKSGTDESLDSSPIKAGGAELHGQDESTKEVPKPGTIIHFSTGSGTGPGSSTNPS